MSELCRLGPCDRVLGPSRLAQALSARQAGPLAPGRQAPWRQAGRPLGARQAGRPLAPLAQAGPSLGAGRPFPWRRQPLGASRPLAQASVQGQRGGLGNSHTRASQTQRPTHRAQSQLTMSTTSCFSTCCTWVSSTIMTRGMIGLMMLVEDGDSEGGCNCAKVVVVVVVVVKGVIVGGVVLVLVLSSSGSCSCSSSRKP